MKTSTKIVIATTAATAALLFVGGVIREIKQIKKLTTDADDACPEEILYDLEDACVETEDEAENA